MAVWDTTQPTADATVGHAHGRQSWARWDTSIMVVGYAAAALLFLVLVNFNFSASASVGK